MKSTVGDDFEVVSIEKTNSVAVDDDSADTDDILSGVKISKNKQNLSSTESDADETKAFVDAQNEITMPFIKKCPIYEKIHGRLVI